MATFAISRATRESRIALAVVALAAVLIAAAPYWVDRNGLRILTEFLIYLGLASLWNLLAGYAGLVSVGQHAYVGLGGYVLFAWTVLWGLPPLAAVAAAGMIGAIVALPVSSLIFRLRGAYFAIGTWVIAEVFLLIAAQISALGGGSGISLPISAVRSIADSREVRDWVIFWTTAGTSLALMAGMYLLLRSRWGLALQAIRENELAAASSGVEVARIKRQVYVFASAGAAMLGALVFLAKLRISPSAAFSVNDWTAFVIFMTVIGGLGRVEGPLVGAIVFFVLRETMSHLGPIYLITLGALAVAVMLFTRSGLSGLLAARTGLELFPLGRRLIVPPSPARKDPTDG